MTYETQRTKLLKHLKSAGTYVSLSSCVRAMGGFRVSARVLELRKAGHEIHIRAVFRGRKHLSFYKLA